jgi:mannose-1-phosphate guanylyltransferase/mannose-1-phosphate guanylyltransferase/mannose-6-phosphate isomerase
MEWSDIGSWDALYELGPADDMGNVVDGFAAIVDSRGCLLRSSGPRIAAIGVENLIIVATHDAVLVIPRGESQRVKEATGALRQPSPANDQPEQ